MTNFCLGVGSLRGQIEKNWPQLFLGQENFVSFFGPLTPSKWSQQGRCKLFFFCDGGAQGCLFAFLSTTRRLSKFFIYDRARIPPKIGNLSSRSVAFCNPQFCAAYQPRPSGRAINQRRTNHPPRKILDQPIPNKSPRQVTSSQLHRRQDSRRQRATTRKEENDFVRSFCSHCRSFVIFQNRQNEFVDRLSAPHTHTARRVFF